MEPGSKHGTVDTIKSMQMCASSMNSFLHHKQSPNYSFTFMQLKANAAIVQRHHRNEMNYMQPHKLVD